MSYIGNTPTTAAFPFDQFTGNGVTTSFTLTYAPAGSTSIIVAISGVVQNPNNYSVIGTTIAFSPAPPTGTNNISVLYLGLPVIGVSNPGNTAFMSNTDLTATAGQTVFASAGSYTVGFVSVFRNGSRLGNADFTATNGTTITLATGAAAGDLITIQYYTLTSLTNALPLTGGTVTGSTTFNTGVNLATVSGNVGIGTSSPSAKLVIEGGTSADQFRLGTGSNYYQIGRESVTTGLLTFYGTQTGANGYVFSGVNGERMRIDSSGNLLVGTTSASAKFSVNNGAAGNLAYFTDGVNTDFYIKTVSSIATIGPNAGSTNLAFQTGGTERGRFDTSGRLYVNQTTQSGNTLQRMGLTFASNTEWGLNISSSSTATGNAINFTNSSATQVGQIQTSTTTTSYVTSSDYRLKNTIAPMIGALDKVALLKPCTYTWNADGSDGQGFIAHELQEVEPNCVTGEKDAIDADGKPIYQGIDTSFLVATLTAAIQEQQALITQLQADVAALKGQA